MKTNKGFITNNYQRNRGKADEKSELYTMECLLCSNEYTVSEAEIETAKCSACQKNNK